MNFIGLFSNESKLEFLKLNNWDVSLVNFDNR
jgi:hypothetical protein